MLLNLPGLSPISYAFFLAEKNRKRKYFESFQIAINLF